MGIIWNTLFIIYFWQVQYVKTVPSLSLCPSPTKNQYCVLKCSDTTITAPVNFEHPSGVLQGVCMIPGICASLNYIIYQAFPDTYLNISSLDRNRDEGEWRCAHGVSYSPTQTLSVSSPLRTQKTPQVTITGSALKVTCEMPCQYPTSAVSVGVLFAEQGMSNYRAFPSAPTVVTDFTDNTGCDSYESNYKAEITFTKSNIMTSLIGKRLSCKCNFTNSLIQTSTRNTGPASALFEI